MSKTRTPLVDSLAKTYPVESDYREMANLAKDLELKLNAAHSMLVRGEYQSLKQKEELFEEMLDSRD